MPQQDLILRLRAEGGRVVVTDLEGISAATGKAEKATASYGTTASKTAESTGKLHLGFGRLFGLLRQGAGLAGFAAIGGIGLAAIKNSQDLQVAQAQLGASVKQAGIYTHGATEEMTGYTDKLALAGGFATPEALQSLSQFVRVTGSVTESQKDLSLATDISRARGKDLTTVTRALMLAEQGHITGLTRMGIVLPKTATAYQALSLLQQRYGGSTAAYAKTSAGAINTLRNTVEIATSKLGLMFAPAITKVAQSVGKFVTQVESGKGIGGEFGHVMLDLGKALLVVLKLMWQFKDVLAVVAIAWGVYAAEQKLATIWMALSKIGIIGNTIAATEQMGVMGGLTAAWAELNVVMDANPVMLVVIAIAALIAIFVLLYDHVKFIHDGINDLWKLMHDGIDWVLAHWRIVVPILLFALTGPFGVAVFEIISHFNQIVTFIKGLPARFAAAASGLWNFLLKGISDIGGKVVDAIISPFKAAFKWVKDHLPQIHIHHFLGVPYPTFSFPKAQRGGVIRQSGPVLVGEAGPEVLIPPAGASIVPLGGAAGAGGGGQAVVLLKQILAVLEMQVQQGATSIQIDGQQVALAMAKVGNRTRAMQ